MRIRALLLRGRLFGGAGQGFVVEGRIPRRRDGREHQLADVKLDRTRGGRLGRCVAAGRHRQVICEESC